MLENTTTIAEPPEDLILRISDLFSGLYNKEKTRAEPRLAESFDVWLLGIDDLSKSLRNGAKKTEFQYHLIRVGKKAKAYAVSQSSRRSSREVTKAAFSQVAQRMDRAMARLDDDDKDNKSKSEVRLLVVPACWVYAFWLVERDLVYLFSAPARFKRLQRPRYLKTQTFLRLLNDELAPFQPLAEQPIMRW